MSSPVVVNEDALLYWWIRQTLKLYNCVVWRCSVAVRIAYFLLNANHISLCCSISAVLSCSPPAFLHISPIACLYRYFSLPFSFHCPLSRHPLSLSIPLSLPLSPPLPLPLYPPSLSPIYSLSPSCCLGLSLFCSTFFSRSLLRHIYFPPTLSARPIYIRLPTISQKHCFLGLTGQYIWIRKFVAIWVVYRHWPTNDVSITIRIDCVFYFSSKACPTFLVSIWIEIGQNTQKKTHDCPCYDDEMHQCVSYMSTWQKPNDGVFRTDHARARWLRMAGCRTCTPRAVHSLTAVAHLNRTLVAHILCTAWQTWGIYWNVLCMIHEQVWTNLLRRTNL